MRRFKKSQKSFKNKTDSVRFRFKLNYLFHHKQRSLYYKSIIIIIPINSPQELSLIRSFDGINRWRQMLKAPPLIPRVHISRYSKIGPKRGAIL